MAWERIQTGDMELDPELNLLLLHALADRVNLASYLPAAKAFFEYCVVRNWKTGTIDRLDHSLSNYLAHQSYRERMSAERGAAAVYGVTHVRPELGKVCPRTKRALNSWKRMVVSGESHPIAWETVYAVAAQLREDKQEECADLVLG